MNDEQRRLVANRLRECRGGWSSGECYYTVIQALGLPRAADEGTVFSRRIREACGEVVA